MARAPRRGVAAVAPGERGFMIVGVVVFILALTILGISLFSLSSFESGFLVNDIRRTDAFHSALGGIERAKFVLSSTDSLGAIKMLEGSDNITYARARYVDTPLDTVSKPLDWSGARDLEIRVLANVQGQRRMIEARFTPERSGSIYQNLITSSGWVSVVDSGGTPPPPTIRHTQTYMFGQVAQNAADTSWRFLPQPPSNVQITLGGVPVPAALSYIGLWQPTATPLVAIPSGGGWNYPMGAAGNFQHFVGGSPGPGGGYGLYNDANDSNIIVNGTVVWLLPGGAYFEQRVAVSGTAGPPDDRLIIVASAGTDATFSPPAGLRFFGGLHSAGVPVILVSNGTVAIEQYNDNTLSNSFPFLSIFAAGVEIAGPDVGAATSYDHVTLPHTNDSVLDDLVNWGILPNITTGSGNATFKRVAGTWREVSETNPN